MSHIQLKTNNLNDIIIKEDDFNELMISNDEDKIFDEFIKYLPLVCKQIFQCNFNVIDIKRLFSINLKIFDLFIFSGDSDEWKEGIKKEDIDEFENVYDKTNYIVNNIDDHNSNMPKMMEAISIVNKFWNKKLDEQKKLGETLKETNVVLEDGLKKINNSIKLKEISDFGKNNINNRSSEVTLKANEYLEEMKKMILDYPESVILKVKENLTNDRDYYSRIENKKKENVDELTIANIISCSMIMLAIQ
jgi:hypothetical protein